LKDLTLTIDTQLNLPSPPVVISHLTELLNKEETSSYELANIVEMDQALTARILKLVNSPFYGFSRKITSVEQAITMLGIEAINQLVLASSVLNIFRVDENVLSLNDFWIHSFGVGVIAKSLLFFKQDKDLQNEAFMCGILHDIGRLILLKTDAKKYFTLYNEGKSVTDLEKEKKWFGLNHQEVGAILGKKWNFPESLVQVIGNHHTPDKVDKYELLVSSVHIADIICHGLSIGFSGNNYVTNFSPSAWKKLQITNGSLKEAIVKSKKEIEHSKTLLEDI